MKTQRILVAGDHGFDYDLYLPTNDDNPPPGTPPTDLRVTVGGAGISLRVLQAVARQLGTTAAAAGGEPALEVGFAPTPGGVASPPSAGLWQRSRFGKLGKTPDDEGAEVWRTRRSLSLGTVADPRSLPTVPLPEPAPDPYQPDVVLVEDNAGGYRFLVPAWLEAAIKEEPESSPRRPLPRWIVLKTSAPVGHGSFWWALAGSSELRDRLVVIVSIKDLRRTEIRVSQGISWERTALDLCRELSQSPALEGLRHARHVIVTLHGEGALWMERSGDDGNADDERRFTLFFDPGQMESEWSRAVGGLEGDAYGYHSTFAASIAAQLALAAPEDSTKGLDAGIGNGLRAMRLLRILGHGPVKNHRPGVPVEALAEVILQSDPAELAEALSKHLPKSPQADWSRLGTFGRILCPRRVAPDRNAVCVQSVVPGSGGGSGRDAAPGPDAAAARDLEESGSFPADWRILESDDGWRDAKQPLYGLGRRVSLLGLNALANVPYARFGDLFTVDRDEIEALRNIQRLLQDYERATGETKPLSIAVFGPPGSGKSFGVKQVAKTVVEEKKQAFLEFNLSQFDDPEDLVGAFHQVRDKVLEGKLPVVFWDEFDSSGFKWLQFLLAPMQDGKFQEGQITHPIGRCIFVFAGGTSYHFDHFGPPKTAWSNAPEVVREHREAVAAFQLKKGPDFKSRLHGCLNVLGPNPRQEFDPAQPQGHQRPDDPEDVCFPVRRAILVRSWLGLMSPKKGQDRKRLNMDPGLLAALIEVGHYTHGARSMEKIVTAVKLGGNRGFHRSALPTDEVLEMNVRESAQFAEIMDQPRAFQKQAWQLAPAIHAAWFPLGDQANAYKTGFEQLSPEGKGDNYAAAVRIPNILGLVGLELVDEADDEPAVPDPETILKSHLFLLGEEEHNGWMEVKLANGWTPAPVPRDRAELKAQRAARTHHCLVPFEELSDEDRDKDSQSITNYPVVARLAGFKIVARRPART
jgi:hypothetical protein